MSKVFRSMLVFVLAVSILLTSNIPVFAAAEEEYLCDLRLVYAETYKEAKEILSGTQFKGYTLLNENLNEDTGKTGVWLAYKTTTDIEEAITDLSVMQMDGGYQEGNYQEMINNSLEEYKKMGKEYEKVIAYFNEAYDADHFPALMAYRQLNFYTIKTEGIDKKYIPDFEGELLGDIFYDGIDGTELATMFMEGNVHVLDNIRALLSMGVSYNEDGMTYLEKVAEKAAELEADPEAFEDDERDYDKLAALISPSILILKDMFHEFAYYEEDLNFEDTEIADEELKYAEHKTLANLTRAVEYLNGKTLYKFCMDYVEDKGDYSALYPLVAALNDGQEVMTKLACYYDVVRYSTSDYPEEYLEGEVEKLEEVYGDNPFNVYEGVDRSVFKGTFSLTTQAYRADAYTETNTLADAFFGGWKNTVLSSIGIGIGAGGIGFMIWGAFEKKAENAAALAAKNTAVEKATALYNSKLADAVNAVGNKTLAFDTSTTTQDLVSGWVTKYLPDTNAAGMSFSAKFNALKSSFNDVWPQMTYDEYTQFTSVEKMVANAEKQFKAENGQLAAEQARDATTAEFATSTILYIVGGIMLLYSALMIGYTVYDYYYPDYADVPLSMVDMRETIHGDRYIKYDVVLEAETQKDGSYAAADLNAFSAQRWNALYYTKSYEAGKPLLADEFVASSNNNKAKDGYTPIHRFGEVVCYDLNKYNFSNKSPSIYLSVKQSKNDKSAVADVPDVVGSIFGNGFWMLFGGAGALIGVGGTLATQALLKKKKSKAEATEKA